MSCPNCCYWCCRHCCPTDQEDGDKGEKSSLFQGARYSPGRQVDMGVVVMPEFEKVPLERVFEFKQPRAPMPVHPQIAPPVVTTQPRMHKSESQSTVSSTTEDRFPMITFTLYYDVQRRTLTVHLIDAVNLPAMDRRGTSDPFVILFLLPNKEEIFESKVHRRTLEPKFDEVFEFNGLLPNEIRRQSLVLRVLDKDTIGSSDYIGGVVLPLEEADLYGVKVTMRINQSLGDVQTDSNGDLLLSLSYNPTNGLIQGVVLKATNLQKMDISGQADPYVKIYLFCKGERKSKWRSSVKKKTLVPIYNEHFQFDTSDFDITHTRLEVYVMDYDRLSRNDVMGMIHFGEKVAQSSGQQHWKEMLATPRTPICRWHSLVGQAESSIALEKSKKKTAS